MDEFNRDDLFELIYWEDDSQNSQHVVHKICREKQAKQAKILLGSFDTHFRLDYHGVVDITEPTDKLIPDEDRDKYTICVISFMGTHSEQRLKTRASITQRMQLGQINFGIINFVRCKDKKLIDSFHDPGSKAWINQALKIDNKAVFIDDSNDHIRSTNTLNIENLDTILFQGDKSELLELLKKQITLFMQ